MLKIRGKITKILEPEVKETKAGKLYIQKVILDNNPDYENQILFQFLGDKYQELNFKEENIFKAYSQRVIMRKIWVML